MKYRELGNTGLKVVKSGNIEVLMFSVNPCYDLQPASEDIEELWAEKNYEEHLVNMDPERQEHYEVLPHHAGGIRCGACETRSPFKMEIMENMRQAAEIFGK